MFRIIKKFIMGKYKFIKDVSPDDEVDKYSSIWFMNAIIDAPQANEEYDLGGLHSWVTQHQRLFGRDKFTAVYLSLIFKDDIKSSHLQKEIDQDLERIQKSTITKEMSLNKKFSISEYIYPLPDRSTPPNNNP